MRLPALETIWLECRLPAPETLPNFNKGDYVALRSFIDYDWDNEFTAVD